MRIYRRIISVVVIALLMGGMTGISQAQEPGLQAVGTAFTYQGRLTDDQGTPLTGQYDFRFKLYDGSGGGAAQVGSTVAVEDLEVAEGRFTVKLDFGASAFTGAPRWLEISVREGASTGGFTQLLPRQELTPAPYAQYAGGVDWSGIDNVPGDLTDGDDDTTYSAGAGLSLSGSTLSADFAGSGGASTVARSDHDHLGQTWVGDGNPLVITGTFGTEDARAPLVVGNSSDWYGAAGLYVEQTGGYGVRVGSAGGSGMYVDSAGGDGVSVGSASYDGVYVRSAGGDGVQVGSAGDNGLEVWFSDDHGIYVYGADNDNDGVGVAGYFDGDVTVTGEMSAGSKNFVIDHPLDPTGKYLYHSSVESPERLNVYNGNITTGAEGYATVTLPAYFEALNRDYRYQLTVIGTFAQAIVAEEIAGNQFVIQTDEPHVKVSWQVTGVRDDPYARDNPLEVEAKKPAREQGYYLHPEAHGQPESQGIQALEMEEGERR
jgi:hypothetical protein